MSEEKKLFKIVSDGTNVGTKLLYGDEIVSFVQKIEWEVDTLSNFAKAKIHMINVPVELKAEEDNVDLTDEEKEKVMSKIREGFNNLRETKPKRIIPSQDEVIKEPNMTIFPLKEEVRENNSEQI